MNQVGLDAMLFAGMFDLARQLSERIEVPEREKACLAKVADVSKNGYSREHWMLYDHCMNCSAESCLSGEESERLIESPASGKPDEIEEIMKQLDPQFTKLGYDGMEWIVLRRIPPGSLPTETRRKQVFQRLLSRPEEDLGVPG
jgi:hypothetical protein